MRVVFSETSLRDLRAITAFIAVDSPARAHSFIDELQAACVALSDKPLRFALIPEFEARGYRRRPYGQYAIVYTATRDLVTIIRVLHTAMDLNGALGGGAD